MASLDGLETQQNLRNGLSYDSIRLVCSGTAWSWVTAPVRFRPGLFMFITHELVPVKGQRKIQTVFLKTRC